MISDAKLIAEGASGALGVVRSLTDMWAAGKAESYIDYTRVSRVEPLCLVDSRVMFSELLPDTMQSLLAIFAGYYMQAVALSCNVGRINVLGQLDRLSPNRHPLDTGINQFFADTTIGVAAMLAMESFTHRLPTPATASAAYKYAMEEQDKKAEKEAPAGTSAQVPRDLAKVVAEQTNLSVGKMLNVELSDGPNKATIPVAVRLMANQIGTEQLVHILTAGNKDTSLKARWHQWKSGEIEFVQDLILCQDLIGEHRKNLMKDQTGFLAGIMKQRRGNWLSGVISANPSIATASNLIVLSQDTAEELEIQLGGSLSDPRIREKLFGPTYVMIMAVVDDAWNRVTFYHRGIAHATVAQARDLKAGSRGSGPDINDVLQAYRIGNAPSL